MVAGVTAERLRSAAALIGFGIVSDCGEFAESARVSSCPSVCRRGRGFEGRDASARDLSWFVTAMSPPMTTNSLRPSRTGRTFQRCLRTSVAMKCIALVCDGAWR